jgi:hypothetical protein
MGRVDLLFSPEKQRHRYRFEQERLLGDTLLKKMFNSKKGTVGRHTLEPHRARVLSLERGQPRCWIMRRGRAWGQRVGRGPQAWCIVQTICRKLNRMCNSGAPLVGTITAIATTTTAATKDKENLDVFACLARLRIDQIERNEARATTAYRPNRQMAAARDPHQGLYCRESVLLAYCQEPKKKRLPNAGAKREPATRASVGLAEILGKRL